MPGNDHGALSPASESAAVALHYSFTPGSARRSLHLHTVPQSASEAALAEAVGASVAALSAARAAAAAPRGRLFSRRPLLSLPWRARQAWRRGSRGVLSRTALLAAANVLEELTVSVALPWLCLGLPRPGAPASPLLWSALYATVAVAALRVGVLSAARCAAQWAAPCQGDHVQSLFASCRRPVDGRHGRHGLFGRLYPWRRPRPHQSSAINGPMMPSDHTPTSLASPDGLDPRGHSAQAEGMPSPSERRQPTSPSAASCITPSRLHAPTSASPRPRHHPASSSGVIAPATPPPPQQQQRSLQPTAAPPPAHLASSPPRGYSPHSASRVRYAPDPLKRSAPGRAAGSSPFTADATLAAAATRGASLAGGAAAPTRDASGWIAPGVVDAGGCSPALLVACAAVVLGACGLPLALEASSALPAISHAQGHLLLVCAALAIGVLLGAAAGILRLQLVHAEEEEVAAGVARPVACPRRAIDGGVVQGGNTADAGDWHELVDSMTLLGGLIAQPGLCVALGLLHARLALWGVAALAALAPIAVGLGLLCTDVTESIRPTGGNSHLNRRRELLLDGLTEADDAEAAVADTMVLSSGGGSTCQGSSSSGASTGGRSDESV